KRLGKSGENQLDVIKRARSTYRDENKGTPFSQEDAWEILPSHAKWDAPELVDLTEGDEVPVVGHKELFGEDARPHPPGKKPNPIPRRAPREDSNTTLRNHITHPHCEVIKGTEEPESRSGANVYGSRWECFQIFFMSTVLSEYELEGCILSSMIKPMKKKLRKYFQHMSPIITCATALNPCFNVNEVDFLIESISTNLEFFDDGFASKSKSYFKESLEGLYNLYYTKYGNPTQSSQTSGGATSSKASGGNNYSRLLNDLKAHTKKARTDPTMSSAYERYVNSDFVTHLYPKEFATFDVLDFWKEKETMFPALSRMAMDIISVQASSVAYEFAFSTSGMVLSIRRTRLTLSSL
nr:zinc finger BED domain-containing protein RICESLEEPER 2-like [Tanacetum cinerariifolium]